MAAIDQLREKLDALAPDTAVIVGDDQHENLLDDNMPAFAVFIGEEVEASASLKYLNQPKSENRTRYRVDSTLVHGIRGLELNHLIVMSDFAQVSPPSSPARTHCL